MQIVTALLVVVTLVPHRFLILTGEISKFTFSVTEKLAVETQSLAENSSMAVLGQRASSPVSGLSQEQTAHGLGKRVRPQQADFSRILLRFQAQEVPEFHTGKREFLDIL